MLRWYCISYQLIFTTTLGGSCPYYTDFSGEDIENEIAFGYEHRPALWNNGPGEDLTHIALLPPSCRLWGCSNLFWASWVLWLESEFSFLQANRVHGFPHKIHLYKALRFTEWFLVKVRDWLRDEIIVFLCRIPRQNTHRFWSQAGMGSIMVCISTLDVTFEQVTHLLN